MKQFAIFLIAGCALLTGAKAQNDTESSAERAASWQQCARLSDDPQARLACFDRWAAQQGPAIATTPRRAPPALASEQLPPATAAVTSSTASAPVATAERVEPTTTASESDCHSSQQSQLSRFWELETGSASTSAATARSACQPLPQTALTGLPVHPRRDTLPPASNPTSPAKVASSSRCAPRSPRAF